MQWEPYGLTAANDYLQRRERRGTSSAARGMLRCGLLIFFVCFGLLVSWLHGYQKAIEDMQPAFAGQVNANVKSMEVFAQSLDRAYRISEENDREVGYLRVDLELLRQNFIQYRKQN